MLPPRRRPLLGVLAALVLLLSGCAAPGPAGPSLSAEAAAGGAAEAPAGPAPEDGVVVEAVRVLPHAYPIRVAGHIKPGPCVSVERACQDGASVKPPGALLPVSAGVEWTALSQAFTDADGLFWRIRLAGDWTSSTPAVESVHLFVGVARAPCDNCTPRVVLEAESRDGVLDVPRTDVFLEEGEDTLAFWVEVGDMRGTSLRPADDIEVRLHGWAAAFVAAGEPIRLD